MFLRADIGERAGTRTQDPLIKSQMLYRLSYALEPRRLRETPIFHSDRKRVGPLRHR